MSNYNRIQATTIAPGSCFGRLTVVEQLRKRKKQRIRWLCSCSCGGEAVITTSNLRGYHGYEGTKSCGCLQKEAIARQIGVPKKHGMSNSPEYNSWQQMKVRCLNPNSTAWSRYGGRGIVVCPEWIDSFEAFFDEVGPKPSPAHSLDRIDVNGNYEPGNIRWATPKEQRANRRHQTRVESREQVRKPGQWFWRGEWRD